jgi:hypothetical protein
MNIFTNIENSTINCIMSLDLVFKLSNNLAMIGWLLLLIVPNWKWTSKLVIGTVVTILALLYIGFIFQAMNPEDMSSFGSLDGILQLFTNKAAVLAGWLHYLAFDLMVGVFIVNDGAKNHVYRFILIPCLLLTFMLGPTGLLLYLIIRWVKTKQYFVELNTGN